MLRDVANCLLGATASVVVALIMPGLLGIRLARAVNEHIQLFTLESAADVFETTMLTKGINKQ
jgi:hypothetical protein